MSVYELSSVTFGRIRENIRTRGVTGKSTFWLAGGDWRREDVEIL